MHAGDAVLAGDLEVRRPVARPEREAGRGDAVRAALLVPEDEQVGAAVDRRWPSHRQRERRRERVGGGDEQHHALR